MNSKLKSEIFTASDDIGKTLMSTVNVAPRQFLPQNLLPNPKLLIKALNDANFSRSDEKLLNSSFYFDLRMKLNKNFRQLNNNCSYSDHVQSKKTDCILTNEYLDDVSVTFNNDLYTNTDDKKTVSSSFNEINHNSKQIRNDQQLNHNTANNETNFLIKINPNSVLLENIASNISESYLSPNNLETCPTQISKSSQNCSNILNSDIAQKFCIYWPYCKLGTKCKFLHPLKDICFRFPDCSFGDNCIYLHPLCKFGTKCKLIGCKFSHTTSSIIKRNREDLGIPKFTGHLNKRKMVYRHNSSLRRLSNHFNPYKWIADDV